MGNKQHRLNFTDRIVTTLYSSDVINDANSSKVNFWETVLALCVAGIVLLAMLTFTVHFFQGSNYKKESKLLRPASVEQTTNIDEPLDEFSLSYNVKIIDVSATASYESTTRAPNLKTISKSSHQEICIGVKNLEDHPEDARVAFNISLYNTNNQILHKASNTFSSGSWVKYVLWECGSEFIDLPVGLYRVEVILAGNIQNKSYRVID